MQRLPVELSREEVRVLIAHYASRIVDGCAYNHADYTAYLVEMQRLTMILWDFEPKTVKQVAA